jgi:hypothetical protein
MSIIDEDYEEWLKENRVLSDDDQYELWRDNKAADEYNKRLEK